jgi:hypothetical protein
VEDTPKRSFLRALHLASLSTARWLRQLRRNVSSTQLAPEEQLESLPRLPPALAPDHELESLSRLPPALAPDHELESLSRLPPALPPINWYPERYLSQSPTLVPVSSNGNFSVPLPLRTALVRDLLCTSMATSSENQFLLPGGLPYHGTENTAIEPTPDELGMPYLPCSDLTGHPGEERREGQESPPSNSEADDPSLASPHPVTAPPVSSGGECIGR